MCDIRRTKSWQRLRALRQGDGLSAQLFRGGIGSLLLKFCNKGLGLFVAVMLARILGPQGYGIYAFVLAVFTLVAIPVHLGLPTLVVRETARAFAGQEFVTIRALWRWSTRFVLLASGTIFLLGIIFFWMSRGWIEEHRLLTFAAGLPLVLVSGLNALRSASLRGLRHVVLAQVPEMVVQPLLILFALIVVVTQLPASWLDAQSAMGLYVLATCGAFVVGAFFLRCYRPTGNRGKAPSAGTKTRWISSILPLALVSGVVVINKNTDLVMLGFLGSDAQVGVYRVAMQGSLLVIFGTQAINQVIAPFFAAAHAQEHAAQLQRLVTSGAIATTFITAAIAILFWLFGRVIIIEIFGREYAGAYLPLSILTAGQVCSASMGQVGELLNMTGHERETLRGMVVSLGSNIALNIALIPWLGMIGAAVATSLSLVVWNFLLWSAVRRHLGINSSVFTSISSS